MSKQLSPQDMRAVDLVLDRQSAQDGPQYADVHNGLGKRMRATEKLLSALKHLTVSPPPPDLLKRTRQRIKNAEKLTDSVSSPQNSQTQQHRHV